MFSTKNGFFQNCAFSLAREYFGYHTEQFISAVFGRTQKAVNQQGKSILGAKVLVLGLAYKKNIDDLRESPALPILEMLAQRGAVVSYHDPYVPAYHMQGQEVTSVPLTADSLAAVDCALIVTDHSCIDRALLVQHAPLIVDTRNFLKDYREPHIVRL